MDHNLRNLQNHILPLSTTSNWEAAKLEWVLDYVEVLQFDEVPEPETCPCGHFPIVELCWIRNTSNGNLTYVGNVCVKRFMGMPVNAVADGFKRIVEDFSKALNAAATEFSFAQGWITEWERNYCLNTARKRNLTFNQMSKRVQINKQLLWRLGQRKSERRRDAKGAR